MFNKIFFSLFFIFFLNFSPIFLLAQNISIHQKESKKYQFYNFKNEKDWNKFDNKKTQVHKKIRNNNCELKKLVFGWNPYWKGTAYEGFDFSLLSDVAYFSYEVDANTGSYENIHYWKTTNLIPLAQAENCRVSLTATLFSNHDILFNNEISQQTLIDSLISLVQYRNAKGINIDFEMVSSSQKDNLTVFMNLLCQQFHDAIPDGFVSIALPAVDWSNVFDVYEMNEYVDLFLIMGYEYYWRGGDNAGPNSPKNNGQIWTPYDISRSINDYLQKGVSKEKLALAIPYYAHDWKTEDNQVNSETTANGTSKTFEQVKEDLNNYERLWEEQSATPYYVYQEANEWHQCWYDDGESLALKYDMINMRDIAGIGIWALGYDGNYTDLWDAIETKLTDCEVVACSGTFTDIGGAFGNYHNHQNYTFTIKPNNADSLKVLFEEFDLELDYDTLFIYQGEEAIIDNLIGAYTGTNSPNLLSSESGAMTFRFQSDGATTESGFIAHWNCQDLPSNIITENYTSKFKIYPNPFEDKIYIQNPSEETGSFLLRLQNIFGKTIYQEKIFFSQKTDKNLIFLAKNIQKGIYILSLQNKTKNYQFKLVKN